MTFIEIVYNKILQMNKSTFSADDVCRFTGFDKGFDRHTLEKALGTLERQGKLKKVSKNKFALVKESELKKCTIFGTSKDYAFAREVGADKNNDIFISVANLNDACHGDTVMVEVNIEGKDRKYRRDLPTAFAGRREGRVVEILERGYKKVVGLVSMNQRGVVTVVPDDRRFCDSIFISSEDINGAENNQKVVVEILDYPSNIKMARGSIVEILGDKDDVKVATLSIIRSFNLIEEFPEDVEEEAKSVAIDVCKDDISGRKDYRDKLIITIDGDDARDFDDAISVEKEGENYRLGVYIADVSHYVRQGSKIDEEAFRRGTSVYFPDHVLPMLPTSLSNGICSLNPNEDRFVLAVEMLISGDGKIVDYGIFKGIIKSSYRMTYRKVSAILSGDKQMRKEYEPLISMLELSAKLAKILKVRRTNAGSLNFDIPEPEIVMNDDGTVKDIFRKPRDLSDEIIEQFMVVTNEVVAKHFSDMNVPFVYRVHETPPPQKLQNFKSFASSLGLRFSSSGKEPSPKDFQRLLFESQDKDYSTALSKVMLKSMQKARYDTENLGHFGLAIRNYCHFTSPIRRYPDLTIHRIISDIIGGKMTDKKLKFYDDFVTKSAEQSSTTERVAEEAERTVDDQKETEFMANKIGEQFDGIISGVTENGFFVELESTIEGFVPIGSLLPGKYDYDEQRYRLHGVGKTYKIGDRVKVQVESVDIVKRYINFVYIEHIGSAKN